jgi:hypothetical protein
MIDRSAFKQAWGHICARFGREHDPKQAAAYFEYLSEQMETEEFLASARAIWATAKWFPRPADFLTVVVTDEWLKVLACVEDYNPPHGKWYEKWREFEPRTRSACDQLGGIAGMKAVAEKDVIRLKAAWEQAYEQAAAAQALALPVTTVRGVLGAV